MKTYDDELTSEDVAALDAALAEPDMEPMTSDQLAMLVGVYEFKTCKCGMTICPACGDCHNIRCSTDGHLMSIECSEIFDFIGEYHIPTKPGKEYCIYCEQPFPREQLVCIDVAYDEQNQEVALYSCQACSPVVWRHALQDVPSYFERYVSKD